MKKVLSLALAIMLVLGMTSVAFGAKITKEEVRLGYSAANLEKTDFADLMIPGNSSDTFEGNLSPDSDAVKFFLYSDIAGVKTAITKAEVRESKIGVQIRASEGSSVVKEAVVKFGKLYNNTTTEYAYVELKFVGEFVSTKDQDFNVSLYATVNKTRAKDSVASAEGTFENAMTTVYEGQDYVFLGDQPVVEADEYIKNIQVDLGEGVSIYTKMFAGKKYYGKVSQEIKTEDESVVAQYPDIETIFYLKTINLNGTGNTVKFDIDTNQYIYVQDENGNLVFLGRTNDKVPYYTKYFIANKELDVIAVTDPDGDDDGPTIEIPTFPEPDLPEVPEIIGGDDAPTSNVNENPGTGR